MLLLSLIILVIRLAQTVLGCFCCYYLSDTHPALAMWMAISIFLGGGLGFGRALAASEK